MNKPVSLPLSTPPHAARPRLTQRAANLAASLAPWAIIAGLLWAGLFIKPQPVGASVAPPLLERRDHLYGLARTQDGGVLACGSNGKILAIAADGSLQRQATPARETLQDIAMLDERHAVAVGNGNLILFSDDAGGHWQKAAQVPRSEVANKLTRVRAGHGGLVIATGEMGALLASHDYGRTWQRLRGEEDVAWNDVAILDDGTLLVVGEFGRILRSADAGASWEELPAPVASSLMAVSFRDASHGVAVGLDGVLLTSQDGGRQWQPVDLGMHDHLLDVLWNPQRQQWFAVGALGRWASGGATAGAGEWHSGVLGERAMAWHTRALADGADYWLAGADIGRWDGQRWSPLNP
ncbi:WD40/YVTN/BNR-like repeat-containing protein [Pseudomonas citronellolis]|uniref:WD40/YVTN/BNR-like repeat-containing protein n=1 Tax=Pseudomonas citronellolis TaxID=53408 RepID=UPI0023E3E105|nr:YCF48-related protein [Pseudomonas citronellolis]MDF3935677.1 YCF48-related protein [Pseudomonas citronellolis]